MSTKPSPSNSELQKASRVHESYSMTPNYVAIHTENYISLYSGDGGLDLGFRLANPNARPVLYVEREFQAAALLVDHIEAELLDPAPVWSDTGTLDCEPFVDRVDWIIGGFPCQPFSVAGKQDGLDDERWLWPHIERLVREIRPGSIFLENVPGLLHGGIEHVLGSMASLGFDAEWITVRASDVGAPHRRDRVFIMAHCNHSGDCSPRCRADRNRTSQDEGRREQPQPEPRRYDNTVANSSSISGQVPSAAESDRAHGGAATGAGSELGDTDFINQKPHPEVCGSRNPTSQSSRHLAHTTHDVTQPRRLRELGKPEGIDARSRESGESRSESASRRSSELGFPPGPGGDWSNVNERYWPAVESEVRNLADGTTRSVAGLSRTARLRILGNGVVPQQAALAFEILRERFN